MTLRAAPHRGTIYRRAITGASDRGEEVYSWSEIATDVAADIQPPKSGEVTQAGYGRLVEARYFAIVATGTDLKPDDVFKVTSSDVASWVGRRFMAKKGGDWGSRGDVQFEFCDTEEDV